MVQVNIQFYNNKYRLFLGGDAYYTSCYEFPADEASSRAITMEALDEAEASLKEGLALVKACRKGVRYEEESG